MNLAKEKNMIFDPVKSRLNGFNEGMLSFFLSTQYDDKRPMGNVAVSDIGDLISAWLVGLDVEIAAVIPRSLKWLNIAIEKDEEFGTNRNFHRATLHWAKALGEWMENGWNVEGVWDDARAFAEAAWRDEKRPWPMNEVIKYGLDDYMVFAYQSGDHDNGYEAGIEMYERWVGVKKLSLSKVLKPREFGYALCLHKARQQFDEAALFEAGKKMLMANLEENWLGLGQFIRAATWLKIVYWHHDPSLTPLATMLKAYDNMPNVPRPKFVSG